MQQCMISSYELWLHPGWRLASWAARSGWCSLYHRGIVRVHSVPDLVYSFSLSPLFPFFYILFFIFSLFVFCLVVNIRIVFLLVIILWWNLDVVEPLMAMITVFVFLWIFIMLWLVALLGWFIHVFGGVSLYICMILLLFWVRLRFSESVLACVYICRFCMSYVWFCFLYSCVLVMTHGSQWGHCEI